MPVPDEKLSSAHWSAVGSSERVLAVGHFEKAAAFYLDHARAVTVTDVEAFAQSLWNAADNFERAGRYPKAIETFDEFIEARPNDPRQLEARRRLARAYQADRQFDVAIDQFEQLVEQHPNSPEAYESSEIGPSDSGGRSTISNS